MEQVSMAVNDASLRIKFIFLLKTTREVARSVCLCRRNQSLRKATLNRKWFEIDHVWEAHLIVMLCGGSCFVRPP